LVDLNWPLILYPVANAESMQETLVVLDGELAVPCNPKSAYAGLNVLQEILDASSFSVLRRRGGPHVTGTYEPRQVREEAAVTKQACVVVESNSSLQVAGISRSRG